MTDVSRVRWVPNVELWRTQDGDGMVLLLHNIPNRAQHLVEWVHALLVLRRPVEEEELLFDLCLHLEEALRITETEEVDHNAEVEDRNDFKELTLKCLDLLVEIQAIPNLNIPSYLCPVSVLYEPVQFVHSL